MGEMLSDAVENDSSPPKNQWYKEDTIVVVDMIIHREGMAMVVLVSNEEIKM